MKDYITSPTICQYLFYKKSDYFNLASEKLRFSLFFSTLRKRPVTIKVIGMFVYILLQAAGILYKKEGGPTYIPRDIRGLAVFYIRFLLGDYFFLSRYLSSSSFMLSGISLFTGQRTAFAIRSAKAQTKSVSALTCSAFSTAMVS